MGLRAAVVEVEAVLVEAIVQGVEVEEFYIQVDGLRACVGFC